MATTDNLGGILDSEYDVLEGMSREDVITYLMEGFSATREEAEDAVDRVGAW